MTLADTLDEAAPRLLARVEAALSPAAADLGARRSLDRLPALMRKLVARLRAAQPGDEAIGDVPILLDVAPLVAALRLLKESIYALIDERKIPVTPHEMRLVGDWFSAVAESALSAENSRFRDLLDAIPDHMLLHSAAGHIIFVNRAVAETSKFTTGLSRDEILGKRVIDVIHDEKFRRHAGDLLERVGNGEAVTEEFVLPSPDGGRWHQQHLRPVYGRSGKVEAIVIASRDIDDRKRAEEQLAQELGFRERMMGILGHDLRNPVSGVLAIAALMRRREGLTDSMREAIGMIEQSARRMNEMIGTLLDFTRSRFHGSLPVSVEETDLDAVAREVVAELQAANTGRELTLSVTGDVRGRWDPGRMAQMISNLAANALSHGALESAVRIALAGEGDSVLLSVSNRGPAIPPALLERMFEPFQQGSVKARGLGLGLFIVREIVRAHGGTIEVRSADDLTSFAVKLPR